MDWCQSSGEPYKPDGKHGLPICQQSQLTTVQIEARCSLMQCCGKKNNKGLHHNGGQDPIFTKRKLCIQVSWIGPSISRGVSQIEI